jgi:hypothetical protein
LIGPGNPDALVHKRFCSFVSITSGLTKPGYGRIHERGKGSNPSLAGAAGSDRLMIDRRRSFARCRLHEYYFWVQLVSFILEPSPLLVFYLPFLGYIGGTVLARLLEIKRHSLHITIVVRSADKAAKFNAIPEYNNLVAVVGSLDEEEKIENLSAGAQYVFNCVRGSKSISSIRM